jgi:hypothetical protein
VRDTVYGSDVGGDSDSPPRERKVSSLDREASC